MLDADVSSMTFLNDSVDDMLQLHSAPHVAHKLLDITRVCRFSLAEIVSCLECDPASALRLLRAANKLRPPVPVDSLPLAVNILGRRMARSLSLRFSFSPLLCQGAGKSHFHTYRRRSLLMLIAAKRLAVLSGKVQPDRAGCIALLADIGMLALAEHAPRQYAKTVRECGFCTNLIVQERLLFGIDHATLGARMLANIGLPSQVYQAVAQHHSTEPSDNPLQQVLCGAHLLAELLSSRPATNVHHARSYLSQTFGIQTDELISLAVSCRKDGLREWDKIEWELDEEVDWQQLLESARALAPQVSTLA